MQKLLLDLHHEVAEAIDEAFELMASKYNKDFILLIGGGGIVPGLKLHFGTDCVVDYFIDTFYDETRTKFYLRYMNRYYRREGFKYEGDEGFDGLNIELMIYCHLWDSSFFLKTLWRIASILSGEGYLWECLIPWYDKERFMIEKIINPLKNCGLKLGDVVEICYDPSVRNAFAHSQYTIDLERYIITVRPRKGTKTLDLDDFQQLFLRSTLLMNMLDNTLKRNHDAAAEKNAILTEDFLTPDGMKVKVYGVMEERGGKLQPEFRLVKVKE